MNLIQGCKRVFVHVFLVLSLLSCDDSTSSQNTDTDKNIILTEGLTGGWKGTYFEFKNQNEPYQSVDLTEYGVSHTMVISSDSSYTANTTFLGQELAESGKISINGNQFIFIPENDSVRVGTYTLENFTLHITILDEEFDFDQDAINEPATLKVNLEKVSN